MKRWCLYLAILLLCAFSPFRGTDISQLSPVEGVWLAEKEGQVYLQTDTGYKGWGYDLPSALEDLKSAVPGTVLLETADYLIIEAGDEPLLVQAAGIFRPSCVLCAAAQMPNMEAVADFLAAHEPPVTLRRWQTEPTPLPLLQEKDGRFQWNG